MGENKLHQIRRYIKYSLQWIFCEKIWGLDFSMRYLNNNSNKNGIYNGYCKTDEKHIKRIFDKFVITEKDAICDIGCGKGAAIKELAKYPFGSVDGVEYDIKLARIAEKNMRKLGLMGTAGKVKIICKDAMNYDKYGNYNYFYFFNSFSGNILKNVLIKILEQAREGYFIYHNPVNYVMVESLEGYKRIGESYDPTKEYKTYIYEFHA